MGHPARSGNAPYYIKMGYFNNEGGRIGGWKAKIEMGCVEPAEEDCQPEEA
jgi:hypothetical protein